MDMVVLIGFDTNRKVIKSVVIKLSFYLNHVKSLPVSRSAAKLAICRRQSEAPLEANNQAATANWALGGSSLPWPFLDRHCRQKNNSVFFLA